MGSWKGKSYIVCSVVTCGPIYLKEIYSTIDTVTGTLVETRKDAHECVSDFPMTPRFVDDGSAH